MKGFLKKSRIFVDNLVQDIRSYLRGEYSATENLFSPASPYGQILEVVQNLSQLIFFYIEDAITELNVHTAFKKKSIYGLARLTGHNPTRAISARGQIRLKFNTSAKSEIKGDQVLLPNWTSLTNKGNGLKYLMKLDQDTIQLPVNTSNTYDVVLIQGEIEEQTVVSNGTPFQTFNITSSGRIDNDNVFVFVNGDQASIYDGLYDMPPGENAVIIKTGIGGGIDLVFGNDDFGKIPQEGANIRVEYIKTDGNAGVISSTAEGIQFNFDEDAVSNIGEEIDLNELMDIKITKPIIFGSGGEDVELTRNLIGSNSRALVLAGPENYIHFLSRYDLFSFIDAKKGTQTNVQTDNNVIYLFLIPNIRKRIDNFSDYFSTDINNFILTEGEKNRVRSVIAQSGRQIMNTELSIVDPILKRYSLNIFASVFDTVKSTDTLKMEIYNKIAEYLLDIKRRDKYPRSEITTLLENTIDGIDSLSVQFVSEENEKAIRNGFYYKTTFKIDEIRSIKTPITKKINLEAGEDPELGFNKFGDIIIDENELPVIRGGWEDRKGRKYEDGLVEDELSSVNVFITDVVKEDVNTRRREQKKKEINTKK